MKKAPQLTIRKLEAKLLPGKQPRSDGQVLLLAPPHKEILLIVFALHFITVKQKISICDHNSTESNAPFKCLHINPADLWKGNL